MSQRTLILLTAIAVTVLAGAAAAAGSGAQEAADAGADEGADAAPLGLPQSDPEEAAGDTLQS